MSLEIVYRNRDRHACSHAMEPHQADLDGRQVTAAYGKDPLDPGRQSMDIARSCATFHIVFSSYDLQFYISATDIKHDVFN